MIYPVKKLIEGDNYSTKVGFLEIVDDDGHKQLVVVDDGHPSRGFFDKFKGEDVYVDVNDSIHGRIYHDSFIKFSIPPKDWDNIKSMVDAVMKSDSETKCFRCEDQKDLGDDVEEINVKEDDVYDLIEKYHLPIYCSDDNFTIDCRIVEYLRDLSL